VEDDDEAFADKMERLTALLSEQMTKGAELDVVIREKLACRCGDLLLEGEHKARLDLLPLVATSPQGGKA
jgi:hypothetical protein